MSKNTKVISLSVPPNIDTHLTEVADAHGHGIRSKVAVDLFEDFLDLDEETQVTLRRVASKRGASVHQLVEFLVDKFPLEDDTVTPIVLKVPVGVMRDPVLLKSWLLQKTAALLHHLHPME